MNKESIKELVTKEIDLFLDEYEMPLQEETVGVPWGIEKIAKELQEMRKLLVEPYASEYLCDDNLINNNDRLSKGTRSGYIVAIDDIYALLYDTSANDFVLITKIKNGGWGSWGIRGDACSTFMAR